MDRIMPNRPMGIQDFLCILLIWKLLILRAYP